MILKYFFIVLFLITKAYGLVPGSLGEKNFTEFAPINNLFFEKEQYQGNLIFRDKVLDEKYIDHLVQGQIWDMSLFINWELYNAAQCPNDLLRENFSLYRFLYRSLTISYLYESIREMEWQGKRLKLKNHCDVNFKNVFKRCKPQTKDMKIFLSNLDLFLSKEKNILPATHNYDEFYKGWVDDYKNSKKFSLSKSRVQAYCAQNNCSGMTRQNLEKSFKNICKNDLELMENVCGEKDKLYGLSQITEANYILSRSEMIQSLGNKEIMQGCLRRFSEVMKEKEVGTSNLAMTYATVFQILQGDKAKREELAGELFKAANLKIFVDKGLEEVLKKDEKPKEKVIVTVAPKAIEKPKTLVSPVKVKKTPKKVVKEVPAPKKEEPENTPQYSAFLTAINFMEEYRLPSVKVDMLKLRYDYIFSPPVLKILEGTIDKYMGLAALKQMKTYDKLGSKNGPVPLMFIKYMIDQEKHTGLYNLINTLGNKFYVENDLDGKEKIKTQYIEIKNDETTKNIWQIFVLDDSQ